jgi:hypothetical protein
MPTTPASPPPDVQDVLAELPADPDAPLPTFALLARLSGVGLTDPAVELSRRLDAAGLHAEEVREIDGSLVGHPEVQARFVEAGVDPGLAVTALHEQLRAAGMPVDEVWLDTRL